MRTALKLPAIDARIRKGEGEKEEIFDPLRKKYVALTPEEWVRQHMIHYLLGHLGYPSSLVTVEAGLSYGKRKKRTDIVVHGRNGRPVMIVECKAPHVPLTQEVLQQAAMYNMPLQVSYLVLTNGLALHILYINRQEQKIETRDSFPGNHDL